MNIKQLKQEINKFLATNYRTETTHDKTDDCGKTNILIPKSIRFHSISGFELNILRKECESISIDEKNGILRASMCDGSGLDDTVMEAKDIDSCKIEYTKYEQQKITGFGSVMIDNASNQNT